MLSSVEKVHPSSHIYVYNRFGLFSVVNTAWSVHILLIQMRHAFSLEKAILWIEDCCCNQKQLIKIQNIFMMKTNKMLIDGLGSCGLFVDYGDGFISCLNCYSHGTHSLQSK